MSFIARQEPKLLALTMSRMDAMCLISLEDGFGLHRYNQELKPRLAILNKLYLSASFLSAT